MQKELNPELFGQMPNESATSSRWVEPQVPTNVIPVDQKMIDLKGEINLSNERMMKLTMQLSEFMKSSQLKFDRITQALTKLDQSHQATSLETSQRVAHLNQRLGERKGLDQKIQEMMDRHNGVLRGFEVRLNHLQKLLSEKENQLASTLALLNETKMEIARLKRL